MSAPGDPGRRLEWIEGPAEAIVAKAVELIGTIPGASSFELRYDAVDRVLAEDDEPGPDDVVRWTAAAELARRYTGVRKPVVRTVEGTALVSPGGSHAQGIVNAVIDLLEALGANVVALLPGEDGHR